MYTGKNVIEEIDHGRTTTARNDGYSAQNSREYARQVLFSHAEPLVEERPIRRSEPALAPEPEYYEPPTPVRTPAERYFPPFNREIPRTEPQISDGRRGGGEFRFFSGTELKPRSRAAKSDLKPSAETLSLRSQSKDRGEEKQKKLALSSRTKIVIGVYAAVIILLIAMIIASGVTASALKKDIFALQTNVAAAETANVRLEAEIITVNNEAMIKAKAAEINMVDANGATVQRIKRIPMTAPAQYEPHTNWFSRVCDWLSGIFN